MTTLNARANQAWRASMQQPDPRDAFEEGWETGHKTRNEEIAAWLEHMSDEVGDGTQRELFHDLAQEIREERDGREPRWPDPSTIASI